MAQEWQYMNTVNGWDKLDVAVSANATQVAEVEVNLPGLRERSQKARNLFAKQAALTAAKQEVTKELQQVIQEGNARARVIREGLRTYLGKDSEKLIEFGVLPFRGLRLNRKPVPPPPAPETSAPPVPAPDSVK